MVEQVRHGHSWSGRERHVAYLNTRTGRFANVSYLTGLDDSGDGRALGMVDWDRDGDLDLWYRNRTAPRLRLKLNAWQSENWFVALRLQGTASNRDAIGATVLLEIEGDRPPLLRSVRAGDLFLSQSSKWLHFGFAEQERVLAVKVRWPGSAAWESFAGVEMNGRYVLIEGHGKGIAEAPMTAPTMVSNKSVVAAKPSSRASVVMPTRIPLFPRFAYRDQGLQAREIQPNGKLRVIVLWSASCESCQQELRSLSFVSTAFHGKGIELVALSVDGLDLQSDVTPAYDLMDKTGFEGNWGFIDRSALERVAHLQSALFDRVINLTVPFTLVLDGSNHVVALHRGAVDWQEVISQALKLNQTDAETLHHLAPPLAGTWFTLPVTTAFVAEDLAREFQQRFPEDALPYLHLAFQIAVGAKKETLGRELASRHHRMAQEFRKAEQPDKAFAYLQRAAAYAPQSAAIQHDLGVVCAMLGDLKNARIFLEKALMLDPESLPTKEALKLVEEQGRQ